MDGTGVIEALEGTDPVAIVAILIATAVAVLFAFYATGKRRERAGRLAERFGDEYGRTVEHASSRRAAEDSLVRRAERREAYTLHPLGDQTRESLQSRWDRLQSGFVDGPAFAAEAAVELVAELAVARGYMYEGLNQCLDDVSVDHPELVADLRRSRAAAVRWATSEHHRQTFVHARALFERLIAEQPRASLPEPPTSSESADTTVQEPQNERPSSMDDGDPDNSSDDERPTVGAVAPG